MTVFLIALGIVALAMAALGLAALAPSRCLRGSCAGEIGGETACDTCPHRSTRPA